jgi:hypothetical protein
MTVMLRGGELASEGKHERENAIQSLILECSTNADPQAEVQFSYATQRRWPAI